MDAEDLLSLRDEVLADLTSALRGGICQTLDLAEAWAKEKERVAERLQYLLVWVRDLRIYQSTLEDHLLVNRDRADRIREEAEIFPREVLSQFFPLIQEAIRAMGRYANARLSLECMFFRMRSAFQRGEGMIYAESGENKI
jgi:DNA polymerase III gamma/tau subunit